LLDYNRIQVNLEFTEKAHVQIVIGQFFLLSKAHLLIGNVSEIKGLADRLLKGLQASPAHQVEPRGELALDPNVLSGDRAHHAYKRYRTAQNIEVIFERDLFRQEQVIQNQRLFPLAKVQNINNHVWPT
jgi:hypothetical protein